MLIAHRGNDNHNYRENSEEAIIYSLSKSYIDGIECDIRLTKDNEIVLFHNLCIDLKSNGSGLVHNFALNELLDFDFENDQIDTLDSVLSKIKSNKIILLEVKEERNNMEEIWIEVLEKILKKYKHLNIYICSFNYKLLLKLNEAFEEPTGLLVGYQVNTDKDISMFDFAIYHYKNFKYNHKDTMIYGIKNIEKYNKYKNKVKYIITDTAYLFV